MMKPRFALSAFWMFLLLPMAAMAGEPALPSGLGGGAAASSEPSLPAGLGDAGARASALEEENSSGWRDALPFDLTGFAETRIGMRLQDDAHERDASIGEGRLQLKGVKSWETVTASVTGDLLYDPLPDQHDVDLESGEGWFDLREANLLFRPTDFSDVKVGRQTLTWGTGDLIFINDMFPKDWNSFFIGRDDEYLKAPSDAVKAALYGDAVNLDIVYTPRFDNDRYIDGQRISYFNGNAGSIVGRDMPVYADGRDRWFSEDELALRLHRMAGPYETALYYYNGFWKSPNGQDALTGLYTFPALSVYGASIRGPMAGGIANAEMGYYDSSEDNSGSNPFVRNSEWRFLAGYEHELRPELTGAVQYYLEHMADYGAYRATLPAGASVRDENRHVITLRLTQLLMNQNLTLSLFNYYSPSDEDGYLRPKASYKVTDQWTVEAGGNLFYGRHDDTFFGQFENNSNLFVSARYGF